MRQRNRNRRKGFRSFWFTGSSTPAGQCVLQKLNDGDETPDPVEYTSIWTPLDAMIVPADSSRLDGAANIVIWNPAHPGMLWDPRVFAQVREALSLS